MVEFHYEDVEELPILESDITDWLTKVVVNHFCVLGDVTYIFCSDEYLLELNRKHLDHDYFTDIITFDYTEEKFVSGDLFISVDRVRDNASNLEVDFLDELKRVMVHGVLHLCGLGDKSEKEQHEMRLAEDRAMELF